MYLLVGDNIVFVFFAVFIFSPYKLASPRSTAWLQPGMTGLTSDPVFSACSLRSVYRALLTGPQGTDEQSTSSITERQHFYISTSHVTWSKQCFSLAFGMLYPFSVVSFVTRLGPAIGVTWYNLCTSIRMASRYGNLRKKNPCILCTLKLESNKTARGWQLRRER
jgi:hypothetical protein